MATTGVNPLRRAAIYCRISMDREGAGLGVSRQEEDCRALAKRLGWPVAGVYVDNDVSAYSGRSRPEWERLLCDVRAGVVEAVLCWHVDRLTRSPRELEDVIDLADRHGLALATVTGDIDLSAPTGRMVARMLGAAARHESEHKGERQRRQARQHAEAGKVSGGGRRPFGYHRDLVTVIESEAGVIRECARRVLAGEALLSITRDLNARRVVTSSGGEWRSTTLRRMLCAARISGRREYVPDGSYTGARPLIGEICATAQWPGIISPEDSDKLRALLTRPERRTSPGGARKALLSGILVCGLCGRPMVSRPLNGKPRYVCNRVPGSQNCGRILITASHTDDYVRDIVITTLDSPELARRLRRREGAPADLHAQIRDDEDELTAWAADLGARNVSRAEWAAATTPIRARVTSARAQLAAATQTTALLHFVGTAAEMLSRWDVINLAQRRAVVTAALERVLVHRATVRNRWDSGRLEPIWLT
ncbi:MAG: recombinase family protein [Pseudonocardiaceae bacterium]